MHRKPPNKSKPNKNRASQITLISQQTQPLQNQNKQTQLTINRNTNHQYTQTNYKYNTQTIS